MKHEVIQIVGSSQLCPKPPQLESWELPTRPRLRPACGAPLPLWLGDSFQAQADRQEVPQTSRPQMRSTERQPCDGGSSGSVSDGRDRGLGTRRGLLRFKDHVGSWELPTLADWSFRDTCAGARCASGLPVKRRSPAPSPVRKSRPIFHVPAGDQSSLRWGDVHSSRCGLSPLFHIGRSSNQLGAPNFQCGREV